LPSKRRSAASGGGSTSGSDVRRPSSKRAADTSPGSSGTADLSRAAESERYIRGRRATTADSEGSPDPSTKLTVGGSTFRGRQRRGNRCDARSRSARERSSAPSVSLGTNDGLVSRPRRGLAISLLAQPQDLVLNPLERRRHVGFRLCEEI